MSSGTVRAFFFPQPLAQSRDSLPVAFCSESAAPPDQWKEAACFCSGCRRRLEVRTAQATSGCSRLHRFFCVTRRASASQRPACHSAPAARAQSSFATTAKHV
jgi:hypothetical protein